MSMFFNDIMVGDIRSIVVINIIFTYFNELFGT